MRTYRFEHELGALTVVPADMDAARAKVAEYDAERPPPEPPLKQPNWNWTLAQVANRWTKQGMTRKEARARALADAEPVPDYDDPAYQEGMKLRRWFHYLIMETYFVKNCVLPDNAPETLKAILGDVDARRSLFDYIVSISELTEAAVIKAARGFRLYMEWETARRLSRAHTRKQGRGLLVFLGLRGRFGARYISRCVPRHAS